MKAIISGGGTGGHIFPAISIANQIKKEYPDAEILFVGAKGRMEMEKVPAAGYEIIGLPISGFQRRLTLKNVTFFFKLFTSLQKAKKIIKNFKPDIAIGVGGYASGPLLNIAAKKGIPALIQEQNSFPGITNKLLAKKVQRICVAYDKMERFFPAEKIVKTGNPVRQEITNINVTKEEALDYFELKNGQRVMLIVGGSLGALTINQSICKSLNKLNQSSVQVIWQTGKHFYETAKKEASGYKNVKVFEFISRMDMAFTVADIIISRAGASTISELCLVGKPCVFVPSPNVSEDHQTKNALALVEKNAAEMVTDADAQQKLVNKAIELLNNGDRLKELSSNVLKLGIPNSAELIVQEAMKIINKNG